MLDQRPSPSVRTPRGGGNWFKGNRPLWTLLAVAAIARIALILQGGQYYFPDESRYSRGALIYLGLLQDKPEQVRLMFSSPEHAGFTILATVLVPLQHLGAKILGLGNWSDAENFYAAARVAALMLGVFSVVNIWLIHRLALTAGGTWREANFSALVAACTASLFYYARHLSPYDCSLALALAGLIFALDRTRGPRPFLAGVCAAGCYAVYNGYWFMVPVIGLALWRATTESWRERFLSFARWSAGGILIGALSMVPGTIAGGLDFWLGMGRFARLNAEGFPAEGWSLPWVYLWHSEGTVGVGLVIAIALALLAPGRGETPPRAWTWLVLLAATYGCLVLVSSATGKFAIYGRTIRPMVPFMCLLGGYALARLTENRTGWRNATIVALAIGALLNASPHFALVFPGDLQAKVRRELGVPKLALSFSGPLRMAPGGRVTRPDLALVNAALLFPIRDFIGDPAGEVLLETDHPLALQPYQYEGSLPRDRALLREHGASMKLIRLANPAAVPDLPPASLTTAPSYLTPPP